MTLLLAIMVSLVIGYAIGIGKGSRKPCFDIRSWSIGWDSAMKVRFHSMIRLTEDLTSRLHLANNEIERLRKERDEQGENWKKE